ncbi:MAG: GNAT family N-acetyltransferase [Gammaproteobacteria bacterium]
MTHPNNEIIPPAAKRFSSFIADSDAMIKAAQELRYRVFAREMGARLKSADDELDYDDIDPFCDHLIVYDNHKNKIAGYTRLLNHEQAQSLGRYYSQEEFDLSRILALPGRFLEIGRTCVDPDYRGGAVLTTLWSALAQYAIEGGYQYLLGCASITPGPSGYAVDAVFRHIDQKNIAPPALKTTPTIPVPRHLHCQRDESGIPPLLKAYLRFGALVCGEPFWDEAFNCMDLLMLLPLEQLEQRYSKHYLKDGKSSNESENSALL